MQTKEYKHLYIRVDYPQYNGYKMEPYKLPDWLSVFISTDECTSSKYVVVRSRIHLNKEYKIKHSYSSEWTDIEVLKDISLEVYRNLIK